MSQINIQELTFAYEGSYDNIFEKASFSIDTDWKLGFIGRNGKGKTTFLNLLMKKFSYEGSISSSIEFEYFPYPITDENRLAIDVISEIHPDYLHWQLVREMNLLEISDELLYRNFNTLSGGEKTKLLLATLFLKENNFLLIDEPTNHLDQTGREIVSRYLNSKKGFILISHDRSFLDGCIDHILSINRSSIEVQKGNFSSWLINKRNRDELELSENRKLLGDIKRFEQSAREKSNWSDMIEKQKTGGAPCDRGYLGHQSARMMKRAKNMEKRQQKAIEEKSKLLKDLDRSFPLKIEQMKFHSRIYTAVNDLCIFYNNKSIFE
ncbi:MAG: ATP-binding cassette domain-containing protein, partial [Peptostreptococcaceae bacterium]|nr:ATP-binding cassette domain-containing protein [Peptostreptococcaceae bacterium]